MSEWVKWLLLGLLSIVFGIVVLGAPIVASLAITTITGVLLLISGGLQVVGGFTVEGVGNKILSILMGAVMLFLGWSFLANPLQGVLTLATVVVILFAAGGIARIILAFQMRGTGLQLPTLLTGVLSLGLAVYVLANASAGLALGLLGILLGIEMILNGVGLVMMGFFIRSAARDTSYA